MNQPASIPQPASEQIRHHIRTVLRGAQRAVITTHQRPDGDAIGSCMGLHHVLCEQGTMVTTMLPDPAPSNLQWMLGSGTDSIEVWTGDDRQQQLLAGADVIIVLDLNDLSRLGIRESDLGEAIRRRQGDETCAIVNIDHHIQPEDFASIQWIDTEAPAVCAMLTDLFQDTSISSETAMAWYVGLMTDTGSFRFPRTTNHTFAQASWLVACGADPVLAAEHVLSGGRFERELLLGIALQSMKRYAGDALCVMVIRRHHYEDLGVSGQDTDGFVHHTLSIAGVAMGILIVEFEHVTKVSFRSKGTTYVRDLAASFGGGGHLYAAGARIADLPFDDAVNRVIQAAVEALATA